jgi:hypothetical protein
MYRSTFSWSRHLLEVSGQVDVPAALQQGNNLGTHFVVGLSGPQSRPGRYDEVKNLLALLGLELEPPVVQLVFSPYNIS